MKRHISVYHEGEEDSWVFLSRKPISSFDDLVYGDPDDYYRSPARMDEDGIIASCYLSLDEDSSGSQYFYPNTTFMHPRYRGKGLGKTMYRTCLAVIKELGYEKDEVEFRRHDASTWGYKGCTSYQARQVYHALRRRGYIERISAGRYRIKKWPRSYHQTLDD